MVLNDDWLNLTPEEALEPDLPILDPHHHLSGTARQPLPPG